MICGDVGSPLVVRFGEKGLVWIEIEAEAARRTAPMSTRV